MIDECRQMGRIGTVEVNRDAGLKRAETFCLRLSGLSSVSRVLDFFGGGPDRGQSPVEWGDFPYVHPYIPPLGHPARPEAQPARSEAQPARPEALGRAGLASGLAG